MNSKEIRGLYEAYNSVYSPQELTEEVEIASEYFYNLGLNEEGVNIFIEELGVEDFGNFVYQLAEEYFLDEAAQTRLQGGGALKGPKGSRPQSTTKARVKAQGGTTMSSSAAPASTVSPKKVAAAAKKAKENQPAKKNGLEAITDTVRGGMERHNKAVADTKKTIGNIVRRVGGVAKEVSKGVTGTARFATHLASKGLGEEVEAWVNALVEEGYDLSEYTWDDMVEIYLEEVENLDEARRADVLGHARGTAANPNRKDVKHSDPSQRSMLHSKIKRRADEMGRERRNSPTYRAGGRPPVPPKEKAFLVAKDNTGRSVRNPNVPDTGSHAQWSSERRAQRDPRQNPKHNANKQTTAESYDLFDYILEHLVAEGYADTNQAALAIMANMSEEWKQSIVEAPGEWFGGIRDKARASRAAQMQSLQQPPKPLPNVASPFAKPASRTDSGKLTTYGAGGGAAAENSGQTRAQVMQQGAKNLENKKKAPVNQGTDFGR